METNSYALFNFLSNLLFYSLTDREVYEGFTRLTRSDDPFIDPPAGYALIDEKAQVYKPSLPSLQPVAPSAAIDVVRGNPGGDGIVIFVGVAEPQPRG